MSNPNYVVGWSDDIWGFEIARALGCDFVPAKSEYYTPENTPVPKIVEEAGNDIYRELRGSHVLTVRRLSQLPDRNTFCRYIANYPRIAASLLDEETFNAKQVDALHPYFILGRQDKNPTTDPKAFKDRGKDIGYRYEAGLFGGARILSFHPHFHREPGPVKVKTMVGDVDVVSLDAVPSLVKYSRANCIDQDWLVVSPDLSGGGEYMIARDFARNAGMEFACLEKERSAPDATKHNGKIDARGRNVLIIDDLSCTLGTIAGAGDAIVNHGDLRALLVHGLMPETGLIRAHAMSRGSGGKRIDVVTTDCIKSDYSRISLIDELVKFYEMDGV